MLTVAMLSQTLWVHFLTVKNQWQGTDHTPFPAVPGTQGTCTFVLCVFHAYMHSPQDMEITNRVWHSIRCSHWECASQCIMRMIRHCCQLSQPVVHKG